MIAQRNTATRSRIPVFVCHRWNEKSGGSFQIILKKIEFGSCLFKERKTLPYSLENVRGLLIMQGMRGGEQPSGQDKAQKCGIVVIS